VDSHIELFPAEEAIVMGSVDERRREFATGRMCARRALAGLGLAPIAITRGARGAPRWPNGVVGSITHCDGYRAAAVAWAREFLSLGIDAVPTGSLTERVRRRIALDQEHVWLRRLAVTDPTISWDRLLFSAKESVYKAWYPLTGTQLDFKDAVIVFDARYGTFDARLLVSGSIVADQPLTGFAGRWLVQDDLMLTAVAVPR
jgi:4'-phosphopantetheinyl transferase EntD